MCLESVKKVGARLFLIQTPSCQEVVVKNKVALVYVEPLVDGWPKSSSNPRDVSLFAHVSQAGLVKFDYPSSWPTAWQDNIMSDWPL